MRTFSYAWPLQVM